MALLSQLVGILGRIRFHGYPGRTVVLPQSNCPRVKSAKRELGNSSNMKACQLPLRRPSILKRILRMHQFNHRYPKWNAWFQARGCWRFCGTQNVALRCGGYRSNRRTGLSRSCDWAGGFSSVRVKFSKQSHPGRPGQRGPWDALADNRPLITGHRLRSSTPMG